MQLTGYSGCSILIFGNNTNILRQAVWNILFNTKRVYLLIHKQNCKINDIIIVMAMSAAYHITIYLLNMLCICYLWGSHSEIHYENIVGYQDHCID